MRAVDAWAIEEQGVPVARPDGARRASGLARRVTAAVARPGPVRIVVGKGNNGGDGLVAARLLREDGREVDVLAAADSTTCAATPRQPRAPARRAAGAVRPGRLDGSGVIVDALLGTGFEGEPREPVAGAIAAINAQPDAPVVACDVPSGVNASTGEVEGEAVRAAATATFHGAKVGLHVAARQGPRRARWRSSTSASRAARPRRRAPGLIVRARARALSRTARATARSSTSGVVVIAGGSAGLTGRAHDGRAGGAARRRGLRAGGGARARSQQARGAAAARADDARPARRRRRAHAGRGAERLAEMAERAGRGGARPGPGPRRGRA